jgi:hypothetical protein
MAQSFEAWAASLAEVTRLDALHGAVVGIEAAEFLDRLDQFAVPSIQRPIKEALLPALGGLPFGLRSVIGLAIDTFKAQGITPFFVFSGLDIDNSDNRQDTFTASTQSASTIAQAWDLYQNGEDKKTVELFKKSGSVTAKHLFRYVQSILRDAGVGFMVAPYGALAQVTVSVTLFEHSSNSYSHSSPIYTDVKLSMPFMHLPNFSSMMSPMLLPYGTSAICSLPM